MILKPVQDNQRLVTITYDSFDLLMERESHIKTTLQNSLDRQGNQQEITDQYISTTKDNRFTINFVLTRM